ncbi:MAG: MucR family transcriptional regulator [Alphaproteobacteria bacterium]|jgi:predicted transcriptional regulator|nr:MucR family transcriptional regulator [Alphaproteobacteria bacterium]MBT5389530.1 MucR family transcriptional regulator [Alphaproteobacteria bacterium]MBT5540828.1 MucR family transcriptional regulator [Alphaproteobacteria bacterium]MBT5653889.1 MucR family transcriptional regulator [Alphaproteobacteria bacterium]
MSEQLTKSELLCLTTDVVSAHVTNNTVPVTELPTLIQQVFSALSSIGGGATIRLPRSEPAVPIDESITPDYIVCLEDGKKLKMLKRHLRTAYNMTIDEYRERWGLGPDYPVVAPNYTKQRSQLAKTIGLGTRSRRRKSA